MKLGFSRYLITWINFAFLLSSIRFSNASKKVLASGVPIAVNFVVVNLIIFSKSINVAFLLDKLFTASSNMVKILARLLNFSISVSVRYLFFIGTIPQLILNYFREKLIAFLKKTQNWTPNNQGICNHDRNFTNLNQKFYSGSNAPEYLLIYLIYFHLVLMELNLKLDKKIFMMTLVKIGWIWSIKNWHHPIILQIMTQTLFVNGIWQQKKDITFPWILNIFP